jgi:hypothetical protein
MLGTILLIILISFRDWGRGPFYGPATTAAAAWASCFVIVLILVVAGRI